MTRILEAGTPNPVDTAGRVRRAEQDELARGRRELAQRFGRAPPRTVVAGELLSTAGQPNDVAFRLRTGWACQFREMADGHRAIVDVYLSGDIIGLDAAPRIRPAETVLALTSISTDAIEADDGLGDLMTDHAIACYIVWLLCQRQRRSDRLLAAISSLDARGRLAMMLLDFFRRLRARGLIAASVYHLPLTQGQIGAYLGLTVVHVNRVLRALRDDHIVNFEKHCVTILDLDRLARLAQQPGPVGPVVRAETRRAHGPTLVGASSHR